MFLELMHGLGVDQTVGIQLGIFFVTYVVLYTLVFKPYFFAYNERLKRTMGRAELAEKYIEETHVLQAQYEEKARALNAKYKAIFDESKIRALKEYDTIIAEAKNQTKTDFETAKLQMQTETGLVRQDLKKDISILGETIVAKLLSKGSLKS